MAQLIEDNPAGRLHEILTALHSAHPTVKHQQAVKGWPALTKLLNPDLADPHAAEGAAVVASIIALPAQIRASVRALGSEDEEHLLAHLHEVESGFAHLVRQAPLHQVFLTFAPNGEVPRSAALNSLAMCSRLLHRWNPDPVLSEENISRIEELVTELMQEVGKADLAVADRAILLRHLHAVLQAVHNIRVDGQLPIEEAVDAMVGAIRRRPDAVARLEEAGVWAKISENVTAVNAILTLVQGTLAIAPAVTGMLG